MKMISALAMTMINQGSRRQGSGGWGGVGRGVGGGGGLGKKRKSYKKLPALQTPRSLCNQTRLQYVSKY